MLRCRTIVAVPPAALLRIQALSAAHAWLPVAAAVAAAAVPRCTLPASTAAPCRSAGTLSEARSKRLYVPKHERIAAARQADSLRQRAADIAREASMQAVQYLSFFRYVTIPSDQLESFRLAFVRELQSLGVRGRIYLSSEGINAQCTCPVARMDDLRRVVDAAAGGAFKDVEFVKGEIQRERPAGSAAGDASAAALDTPAAPASTAAPAAAAAAPCVSAFTSLQVRIRPRLVNDGLDAATHAQLRLADHGDELDAAQWHAEMEALRRRSEAAPSAASPSSSSPPPPPASVRIVDCRNWYESDVGRFEGAIPADTSTFAQTFAKLEEIIAQQQKELAASSGASAAEDASSAETSAAVSPAVSPTMYVYCTGGIRCVKVGAYLRAKHPGHAVKLLKGGINAYANFVREQEQLQASASASTSPAEAAVAAESSSSSAAASGSPSPSISAARPFQSTFRGKNFVFDSRTEGGEASLRVTDEVLSNCAHCGTPWDTHVNCRNARCHALFLQCAACAKKMEQTCSDECKEIVQAVIKATTDPAASASSAASAEAASATASTTARATPLTFADIPRKDSYEFRPRITWAAAQKKNSTLPPAAAVGSLGDSSRHVPSSIANASFHSWSRSSSARRSFSTTATAAVASPAAISSNAPVLPCPILASYCIAHSTPPASAKLLESISSRTHLAMPDRANMLSDGLVGALVRSLALSSSAASSPCPPRFLELGTFTGYTTAWLLDCLMDASSPAGKAGGGSVVSCELREEYATIARDNLAAHPRAGDLRLMVGPALESLNQLADELDAAQVQSGDTAAASASSSALAFDFVYIDCNKKSLGSYADLILRRGLLRPSGLMLLDNTLWKGRVASTDARHVDSMARSMHDLNKRLAADESLIVTLLPVRDGVTIVQRRSS